jgi:hypothetical protein
MGESRLRIERNLLQVLGERVIAQEKRLAALELTARCLVTYVADRSENPARTYEEIAAYAERVIASLTLVAKDGCEGDRPETEQAREEVRSLLPALIGVPK